MQSLPERPVSMSIPHPTTQTTIPGGTKRGRVRTVRGIQNMWLIANFGSDWLAAGSDNTFLVKTYKKHVLDRAVSAVIAKYGSQSPWRTLVEDVPEPPVMAGDAAGQWAADGAELADSQKRILAVSRTRRSSH